MSNFQSIAGATLWMLVSALLTFAALTPVSLDPDTRTEIAAAASASSAAA